MSRCLAMVCAIGSLWFCGYAAGFTVSPDQPRASPEPSLPTGLTVTQLNGSLVCPPLVLPETGIIVACDDRTVSLVQVSGATSWHLEFDRSIRGPLSLLSSDLVLLPLSGGQLACFGTGGTLVWQRRLDSAGESSFLGSPDGRIIQVWKNGTIHLLNPDASFLFSVTTAVPLNAAPRARLEGIELPLTNGTSALLDWTGILRPAYPSAIVGDQSETIRFHSENLGAGRYQVSIKSALAVLDFSSQGTIGHWTIYNQSAGLTVVWGDSLWRCFIFHPAIPGNIAPSNPVFATDLPPSSANNNLSTSSLTLEAHYLKTLISDDPLNGSALVIEHIREVANSGKLAGRLRLYEDILLEIIATKQGRRYLAGTAQRVRAINTLAGFPSLRQSIILLRVIRQETDIAVVAAWLDYCGRLAVDPGNQILNCLVESLPLWQARGEIDSLRDELVGISSKFGPSWGKILGLNQMLGHP